MTETTQILHSVRYRLAQAVTKLAPLYPDTRKLRTALNAMIDGELKAIEAERSAELGDE